MAECSSSPELRLPSGRLLVRFVSDQVARVDVMVAESTVVVGCCCRGGRFSVKVMGGRIIVCLGVGTVGELSSVSLLESAFHVGIATSVGFRGERVWERSSEPLLLPLGLFLVGSVGDQVARVDVASVDCVAVAGGW